MSGESVVEVVGDQFDELLARHFVGLLCTCIASCFAVAATSTGTMPRLTRTLMTSRALRITTAPAA